MENIDKNKLHKLCIEVAAQSPCAKRKVGAVLALRFVQPGKEDLFTPLAIGFNRNLAEGPCECEDGSTKETVIHAEVAAINEFMAANGKSIKDMQFEDEVVMFVTHEPCNGCKAALASHNLRYEVVGTFMKFDSGKPRMSLVPPSLAKACARALGYGAKKYKVDNWRNVEDLERYVDALQRHFDDWREAKRTGNVQGLVDADSGLNHLDGMAANLSFLIELQDLPLRK